MSCRSHLIFAAASMMMLAACTHEREFRVAYVGSEGSAQIAGDEQDDAGSRPMIAAGNTLLGPAGALAGNGTQPGVASGTVATILPSTNQTLVQLTNGATVLLNGAGGTVGDIVAIDLGAGRVIGGSAPLIGTSVLNPTGALGQIGTAPPAAGNLVSLPGGTSAVTGVAAPVTTTTTTVTNILTRRLGGGCC